MFTPKFIKNICFKYYQLRAIGRSGKSTRVFAQQGNLDGSCCIYSLMMFLIFYKLLDWQDLTDSERATQNPFVESIQEEFLSSLKGYCKGGHNLGEISERLNRCYGCNLSDYYHVTPNCLSSLSRRELHRKIKAKLDKRMPVMLAYRNEKGSGHAVLAIGYCKLEKDKLRLFCLDPSKELRYAQIWNLLIDLDFLTLDDWTFTDHTCYSDETIIVDEILLIKDSIEPSLPFNPATTRIPF